MSVLISSTTVCWHAVCLKSVPEIDLSLFSQPTSYLDSFSSYNISL